MTELSNFGDDTDENHLHGMRLVIFTITLMLGQFLTALDTTVLATAIPTIVDEFQRQQDVGWYGSAYLLTTMALQPTFGKVYTYFDFKWTFAFSILIFEVGSALCAAATNSPMFIAGRAVAGVGQAAIVAGGMAVIGYCVPLHRRALFFAIISSVNAAASVAGPIIGGVLTDTPSLTWRFAFWVNLPAGAVVLTFGLLTFKSPKRPTMSLTFLQKMARIDLPGALLFMTSITSLMFALNGGGVEYAWSEPQSWTPILGFVIGMGLFIVYQIRLGDEASIPFRIICQRTVLCCCLYSLLVHTGFSATIYFLPFYFQTSRGTSAEESGRSLVAFLASTSIMEIGTGALLLVIGYFTPFMLLGAVLFCVGSALLTTLHVNSPLSVWLPYQVLAGIGFGSGPQMTAVGVHSSLASHDLPIGNAIWLVHNFMGLALGVSIAQNVFSSVLRRELSGLDTEVDVQGIMDAGITKLNSAVPKVLLSKVTEAYNQAITSVFFIPVATCGLAFLVALGIEWRSVRGDKPSRWITYRRGREKK